MAVKAFGVAKARLASLMSASERARLGKAVAQRVAHNAALAGAETFILTGDDDVALWASGLGFAVIREGPKSGLDAAAATAVEHARTQNEPWAVVLADLPVAAPADFSALAAAVPAGGLALAPSRDGGTNALAGDVAEFDFSYGPSSFHRHCRTASSRPFRIVARAGLALDLDAPEDLRLAVALPQGGWLGRFLETPT